MPSLIRCIALCLFAAATLGAAAAGVNVIRADPATGVRKFDPKNKPAEMPELHGTEQAVCTSKFGITCQFQGLPANERQENGEFVSQVQLKTVTVRLSLDVTQWVPYGAGDDVRAHEDAHRDISLEHYKNAEEKARPIAVMFVDKLVTGKGSSRDEARRDAVAKASAELCDAYLAAVQKPSARVNDLFDEVTDHGRRPISNDDGKRQAYERYRKEQETKVKRSEEHP